MSDSAKAIFLSHASEDAEAARRVCEALRAAGLEVWFDQSELRGGDAWDATIRGRIKACGLFIALVSASTEARSEGYFRREWSLAVDRMMDMAEDRAFLVTIAIDATPDSSARVPERFRERQWLRLEAGELPPAAVERIAHLLGRSAAAPPSGAPRSKPAAGLPKRAWRLPVTIASIAAIAAVGAAVLWISHPPAGPAPAAPAATRVAAPADRKAIAVLPFENLSGRPEDAYLADGLQEEILNAVARMRDLKVISRTSVMGYRGKSHNVREIGQRLGVGTVLEGSIRRDASKLRLTVQLIDAHDDRHLLAVNYDRELDRILDLQSTVARVVADSLSATLGRLERDNLDRVATNSGDAYDRYLRALALFRRPAPGDEDGLAGPKRLLGEAVRFDSGYAEALALLSQANTWTFFSTHNPRDGAAARKAFEKALAVDPQLPEAHLARGLYSMYVETNLDQALADFASVVRAQPSSAEAHQVLAFALRRRGRMEEALEHARIAWDLDPLNANRAGAPIITLLGLRRFPEAIEQTRIQERRFPTSTDSHFTRARIEAFLQRSPAPLHAAMRDHGNRLDPKARKAMEAEIARADGRYLDAVKLWDAIPPEDPMDRRMRIGFLYHAAGDATRARRAFVDVEREALAALKRTPELVSDNAVMVALALAQSMQDKHAAATATIETLRTRIAESSDATNGPSISFIRSVILVRAGRRDEGYAEVGRLLRTPFGGVSPSNFFYDPEPVLLLLKGDPRYDELINRPPRL